MGEKVIPIRSVWLLRLAQRKWGRRLFPSVQVEKQIKKYTKRTSRQ